MRLLDRRYRNLPSGDVRPRGHAAASNLHAAALLAAFVDGRMPLLSAVKSVRAVVEDAERRARAHANARVDAR